MHHSSRISKNKGVIHVLDDKKLRVEGSDWAILLLTASSSFDGPFTKPEDSKKDPTSESLSKMNSVKKNSYADLYARHLDDYQNLFHRVSLQLSKSSKTALGKSVLHGRKLVSSQTNISQMGGDVSIPTSARVKSFQTDEDPSFVELLFQYGRYLLISCSRPGTQVANLQGIWNKDVEPAWDKTEWRSLELALIWWQDRVEVNRSYLDLLAKLSRGHSKLLVLLAKPSGVTRRVELTRTYLDLLAKPSRGHSKLPCFLSKTEWNHSELRDFPRHILGRVDQLGREAFYVIFRGTSLAEEHFASNPDQVIVTRFSASKPGSLSFTVYFDSKMHHSSRLVPIESENLRNTTLQKLAVINLHPSDWDSSPVLCNCILTKILKDSIHVCCITHIIMSQTQIIDFLKNKAYPLLEGCTSFLLDWLIEGRGGLLETNPSTSPEHMFIAPDRKPASVSYSSTMDISIIKEVFSIIISAAEVLGRQNDGIIKRVTESLSKLPPTKVAGDGSIMEWAEDFEDPDVHHRHVSHLFGLFPGHTISLEKTPDLCKAVELSLIKRGDDGPGWSTTWKASLWAHLHNSEHAYRMIKHLIVLVDPTHERDFEGGLYSNLFTAHPPFQIDANFG
uniref:Alpha-L-fucosidase 2 n=1 Tax=Cajanus cajan TaxID=3821 RepID=A0A151U7L4_CAJCA|nr:Alpha-L-fucosidase 2 [Cajanus cajan]